MCWSFSLSCFLFNSPSLILVSPSLFLPLSPLPLSPSFYLTTFTERPQPPRKLSVPQEGVESRHVRLHWVTGSSGSSPLRYFTLQAKELPNGDWNAHTADIPHNGTTWTADRYTCAHMCSLTHTHVSACVASNRNYMMCSRQVKLQMMCIPNIERDGGWLLFLCFLTGIKSRKSKGKD